MSIVSIPGIFQDGDHKDAFQVGPTIWERPFERDSMKYVYRMTMRQANPFWTAMPVGTIGPAGGYLVNESVPKPLQDSLLVEFVRTFAVVPASRNEYEPFVYPFPHIITTGSGQSITNVSFPVTSRVQYDYYYAPTSALINIPSNPYNIPIIQGVHYFQLGPLVYYFGTLPSDSTIPSVSAGEELVAEDSLVKPWMGFIFERKTRFVPNLDSGEYE